MQRTCPVCGKTVLRARGNLRSMKSWQAALEALLARHMRLAHPTAIEKARGR